MFEMGGVDELDQAGVLAALASNRVARLEAEARELVLAVAWADLHNPDADLAGRGLEGVVLPGTEGVVRHGADGTPPVLEFAAAEFASVNGMHPAAGENLIGDGLDLRHRHPGSWAGVCAGMVRAWQARKVTHLTATAGLSRDQARWVDAQVVAYYNALPWVRFVKLVEAKIIEADPAAARERERAAALEQFVRTGQCNEYGLKTVVAKAAAGDVIFFVAMCDRIAAVLLQNGDTDPVDVRRAKAVGILATPTRAQRLLDDAATLDSDDSSDDADDAADGSGDTDAEDSDEAEGVDDPGSVGEQDVHPSQNDADDPTPQTHPCPTCAGDGVVAGDPSLFRRPARVDPGKLLPAATLYVHLSQAGFEAGTGGVARVEGVGPVTVEQACAFLAHTHVTIRPVLDVAGQVPVDGYETPAELREALQLRNPACVFPWATNTGRRKDGDHTIPYLSPDKGGPPGQTSAANLGLLARFAHRLKTHGRWRLRQPRPGVFFWRSPHGYYYTVDHTGTHPVPKTIGDAAWTSLNTGIDVHPAADDPVLDYETSHQVA
ncbi:MAG TPA: hypothetical protein VFG63_12780 [Nocardioidaceae bacterium]|nr:hypothetical protein [Nocardioidaceae bacterium]